MDYGHGSHENGENKNNSILNNNKVGETTGNEAAIWNHLPVLVITNILDQLLDPSERLKASSACKSWRDAIYQPRIWPHKHLNINLCSYKFPLSWQGTAEDNGNLGIHMFNFLPYYRRQSHEQDNASLHQFLNKCSRLLQSITIYFDPNSRYNVNDVINIVRYLSEEVVLPYQHNNQQKKKIFSNCRALRSFSLCPVTAQTRVDESFLDLYWELNETVKHLISKIESLEHISFGSLETVLTNLDGYMNVFYEKGHHTTIKCLHLGTMKSNVLISEPIISNSISLFMQHFTALRSLTIDYDLIDTKLITSLASFDQLQSITINVHRNSLNNHEVILKNAWNQVHTSLPRLKATINLLNTNLSRFDLLIDSLIKTKLPIEKFAAYYLELDAEHKLQTLLEKLARHNNETLRRLVLVDHINKPNWKLIDQGPNPLTMLAWQCKHLEEITVFGFILDDIDVLAIARLRGQYLQQLNVPAACVKLTRQLFTSILPNNNIDEQQHLANFNDRWFFNTAPFVLQRAIRECISLPLKRAWRPIFDYNISSVMFNSIKFPQLTYHRTVLEQKCLCKSN